MKKKSILIVIAIIALTFFAGCSEEVKKYPRAWCEEEVIYWFEYDYSDFEILATQTTELRAVCQTDETDSLKFEAYRVIVFYEEDEVYLKTYIATIYYQPNSASPLVKADAAISKHAIVDLDVAEVIDASVPNQYF